MHLAYRRARSLGFSGYLHSSATKREMDEIIETFKFLTKRYGKVKRDENVSTRPSFNIENQKL